MLQNDLFYFSELQAQQDLVKTNIRLNSDHAIFKGHFPGQPILPGVCMLQMVKEITERHVNKTLQLVKADDLKFLSFVDPNQAKSVRMELKITEENQLVKVIVQLYNDSTLLFKFKGSFNSGQSAI